MEKTCLINPATGRAIKIDGRLGKRVLKKQEKEFAKQQPPSMVNARKAAKNPEAKPKRTYITKKKKEEASKVLQGAVKRTLTKKQKKENSENIRKFKEEKNIKILGDKTAKDVFKIVKDYLSVWNYANYKKSKLDKRSYLVNHQDAWGDVFDIVDAYGEEKLIKTLNEKDKKIFNEYKNQAKLQGTLEKEIIQN